MTGAETAAAVIGGLMLLDQKNQDAALRRCHKQMVASIEQGDYRRGVMLSTTLLKSAGSRPGIENVYQARAYCYRELGEFDEALSDIDRALDLAPDDTDSYSVRLWVYYEQGFHAKAISDATEIVKRAPSNDGAFAIRARLLREVGNYDEALADVLKAISIHPGNAAYYVLKGAILRDRGQLEPALEAAGSALGLDPQSADGLRLRGELHLETGNFQGAVDDLSTAIEMRPPDAELLECRAEAYEGLGILESAAADRDRAAFASRLREIYRKYLETARELYDNNIKIVYSTSDLTPPTNKGWSAGCLAIGGGVGLFAAFVGLSEDSVAISLVGVWFLLASGWVAHTISVAAPRTRAAAASEYFRIISTHEQHHPQLGVFFERYLGARKSGDLGSLFSDTWQLLESDVLSSKES